MERIDISDDRSIADLVEAMERSGELLIVRDGVEVAEVRVPIPPENADVSPSSPPAKSKTIDLAALEALRAAFPLRIENPTALIRELRDAGDH